jgi:hypothetical protein
MSSACQPRLSRSPRLERRRSRDGRGGRRPKPVKLHKIEGTYQPVRHAHRAQPADAPGELAGKRPPPWMNPRQRKLYRELLADAPPGVLRRIDSHQVAAYAELLDR